MNKKKKNIMLDVNHPPKNLYYFKTKALIYTFVFLVSFIFSSNIFAVNKLYLGTEAGYGSNILKMKYESEGLQSADDRVLQRSVEVKDYYGDRVQITDIKTTGGQLISVPFGINLRYIYNRLQFKFAFLKHSIIPNVKSYVMSTRPGVDSSLAALGIAHSFYEDYYKNLDGDMSNNIALAYGMFPSEGKSIYVESTTIAEIFEIPFTISFILIGKDFYKFYLGAGITYFNMRSVRTILVKEKNGSQLSNFTGANSQADIDEFTGNAIGFHFLIGSEVQITKKVGLYMEFSYNIGAAVPLEDKVRTGADTTTTLFHSNDMLDLGGSEVPGSVNRAGLPRMTGLNMEYIRLSFGLSYQLFDNQKKVRKYKRKKRFYKLKIKDEKKK